MKVSVKDALTAKRYCAWATWVFDNLIANTIEMTKFAFVNYYTEVAGGLKELLKAMNIPEPSEELDDADSYDADIEAKGNELEDEEVLTIDELTAYQSLD